MELVVEACGEQEGTAAVEQLAQPVNRDGEPTTSCKGVGDATVTAAAAAAAAAAARTACAADPGAGDEKPQPAAGAGDTEQRAASDAPAQVHALRGSDKPEEPALVSFPARDPCVWRVAAGLVVARLLLCAVVSALLFALVDSLPALRPVTAMDDPLMRLIILMEAAVPSAQMILVLFEKCGL
ncbi:MAG: hypothetical protein ACK41Y_16640, partial [Paracoccus hibiscisoli]|uniref:hypothetical protein n=1 Tax=Paracoccus hibiscisoli TaxID=2023261 RepID=UPI00391C1F8D